MDTAAAIAYFLSVKSAWVSAPLSHSQLYELAARFYLRPETLRELITEN